MSIEIRSLAELRIVRDCGTRVHLLGPGQRLYETDRKGGFVDKRSLETYNDRGMEPLLPLALVAADGVAEEALDDLDAALGGIGFVESLRPRGWLQDAALVHGRDGEQLLREDDEFVTQLREMRLAALRKVLS